MITNKFSNSTKSCPLCGNTGRGIFSKKDDRTAHTEDFIVYRCRNCNTEYITPPKDLAKFYETGYFTDMISNNDFMFRFKRYIIKNFYKSDSDHNKFIAGILINFLAAVPEKFANNAKIMDIGCGPGDVLYLLKEAGFDAYGLEISDYAVEIAHKHGLHNVVQGTEFDLEKYPDNYFSFIRGSHVIEHMTDPKRFVSLSYDKLATGGKLLIQTPNISSSGKLFGKSSKYYYDIPRHVILFSSKSLKSMLEKAGFKNIKISYLTMFSDFKDNLVIWLNNHVAGFKNSKCEKLLNSIVGNYFFLPVDLVAGILGHGQTVTITAEK